MANKKVASKNHNILQYFGSDEQKKEQQISITDFIAKKISNQVRNNTQERNVPSLQVASEEQVQGESALVKENERLNNDLKKAMALLKDAGVINLNKDIHIEQLNRKVKNAHYTPTHAHQKESSLDNSFSQFRNVFDKFQLKKLRSISAGKSSDSTFVLTCVRFLYPNPNALINKSVDGRSYKKQHNSRMTPKKVEIVTDMLNERLSSEEGVDALSASERFNRVKKLIKDAIFKITKPLKETALKSTHTAETKNAIEMIHHSSSYRIEHADVGNSSAFGFDTQNVTSKNPYG